MNLFQDGKFTSAAGIELDFKIDCDALSDESLMALAKQARKLISPSKLIPVPTGGIRFAAAIEGIGALWSPGYPVIIDDVWTTGASVLKIATEHGLIHDLGLKVKCCVIVARGDHPHWVKPLFTINSLLKAKNFLWTREDKSWAK